MCFPFADVPDLVDFELKRRRNLLPAIFGAPTPSPGIYLFQNHHRLRQFFVQNSEIYSQDTVLVQRVSTLNSHPHVCFVFRCKRCMIQSMAMSKNDTKSTKKYQRTVRVVFVMYSEKLLLKVDKNQNFEVIRSYYGF